MAGSSADRAPPLGQPGGSSPVDITDTPDIAGCAVWPMAGTRGEDHQEPCHTGISTPRGGPWRTSNVDGILRSLRLDAEAAAARAAAGGDRRESAPSRPRAAPGAHRVATPLRHTPAPTPRRNPTGSPPASRCRACCPTRRATGEPAAPPGLSPQPSTSSSKDAPATSV